MLLGDELWHGVLSRSCHCSLCLGPSSVEIVLNILCHGANGNHVHCFQFLDNIVVDNAKCSGVVHLYCGQRLGMAHELEGMAGGNGFSAVDVESPHLSLCCRGHDRLDNLWNCEDGAIVWWFSCAAGCEEMFARPAVCL